jgi:uncharacterized protein
MYHQIISGDFMLILQERDGHFGPAKEDETADFYFDPVHSQIDISPFIYDEIMISLPLKPLCKIDCKGIVVNAGKKARRESEYDPRWEALRTLKEKM